MSLLNELKDLKSLALTKLKSVNRVTAAKYTAGALVLAGLWSALTAPPTPRPEDATVMIVGNNKRGGGTGVVISSSASESKILTNAHVCRLVVRGGLVINPKQEQHTVASYRVSKEHDLCLVTVAADLHANTKVASVAAELTSAAKIAGHPALLPMVVTRGHYSDTQIIRVLTGARKCEEKDLEDESLGLLCTLFRGVLPVIKTYEAQLVTATIMPGSSGSAVYNDKGELTNVVFAGSGDIGYAFTVPHGYVANFLNNELKQLETDLPNYEIDLVEALRGIRKSDMLRIFGEVCNGPSATDKIKEICSVVLRDLEWRKLFQD